MLSTPFVQHCNGKITDLFFFFYRNKFSAKRARILTVLCIVSHY